MSSTFSNSGTAVISLSLSATACSASTKFSCTGEAVTRCRPLLSQACSKLRPSVLPSMATCLPAIEPASSAAQRFIHPASTEGFNAANSRRNVLTDGMPCGRTRNVLSQSNWSRPNSTTPG